MLKPLRNKIVVEMIKETSKFGIVIPLETIPQYKRSYHVIKGKVLAVGEGKINKKGKREPMQTKVGDIILYPIWAADKVKEDSKEYHVFDEEWIFAYVE